MKDTKGWGENGMKFDWQFEEAPESKREQTRPRLRLRLRWLAFLTGLLIMAATVLWGWHEAQSRADARLITDVQNHLAAEQMALLRGDMDLLQTLYQRDPALFAAAFQNEYRRGTTLELTPDNIVTINQELHVTVLWGEGETRWQRLLFFERNDAQLVRRASSAAFWGSWQTPNPHTWGELHFQTADAPFQDDIALFVEFWLATECRPCLHRRVPFTLTIAPDWQLTAAPGQIRVPSPHLVALDALGQPGEPFWTLLAERLADYLTPATIRFAVPGVERGVLWENTYQPLVAQFQAYHPEITVELVVVEKMAEAGELLQQVDGAALPVDAAALRAGFIHDLTDLAATDPVFQEGDFYEHVWQGAWWQGRLWLMPQAATIPLLFYDEAYYQAAGQPFPELDWTWAQWQTDLEMMRQTFAQEQLYWPYLDVSRNTLLAYSFNWDNHCAKPHPIQCPLRLEPNQIAAALQWYRQLTPTLQPDLTGLAAAETELLALNLVSIPRQVVIWVSEPGRYELESSLGDLGVTIFPGTETHPGMTPLHIEGSLMSAYTTRPRAVWQWLNFLSYQPLERGRRTVPARPSVASAINYWGNLITPLRQPMLTAFANGRPILLAELELFNPTQLEAVLSGEMSPFAAASTTFNEP